MQGFMQDRRNEAKNIDIDTINNEPKILKTLGLTLEEVEEYIELQKERKKNDKMFSDVIVCKTYEDFDKQAQLIRQKGIGNNKRKVLIKQNSDGHIAFYIFFKNPNGGLDVFTHHTNFYPIEDNPAMSMKNYRIRVQSDSVSCGVVALECIKYLTYEWYKQNIENIEKTTKDMGIIDNKVLPAQVLKYWQSVEGLKTNFPEIYNSLIIKKRIKFVKNLEKERNYALPQKAVIISKYNDYLDKKTSEKTEFDKQTFIKNTLKLREKEIQNQEKEIKSVANDLRSVVAEFDKNISRGLVKEDECENIDRLLKDFDVKLRKRYRKKLLGQVFFNTLNNNYSIIGLTKISHCLIERHDKRNNQSCFEISKEWVEEHKTQIELMNGIRQQVENFHHDLQIWLSSKQVIDRKKCDTFEKILLKTLKQFETINKHEVEEVFLNAEFCRYDIRLDKIVLDFLKRRHCKKDEKANLYDIVWKNVTVTQEKKVNNVKKKLSFHKYFYQETKPTLPPRSDTFEIPSSEIINEIKISNDNRCKNNQEDKVILQKGEEVYNKKFVSNDNNKRNNEVSKSIETHIDVPNESFRERIKRIFSCCSGYDLSDERDSELNVGE